MAFNCCHIQSPFSSVKWVCWAQHTNHEEHSQKSKEAGSDEYLAFLFRNSPISGMNESPAQLLMGRSRCSLPMVTSTLDPLKLWCFSETDASKKTKAAEIRLWWELQVSTTTQTKWHSKVQAWVYLETWHGDQSTHTHTALHSYICNSDYRWNTAQH